MTSVRKAILNSVASRYVDEQNVSHQHDKMQVSSERLSTGVPGLDEILYGGLIPQRAYLLRGGPGSGKTTLGIHFLAAGAANGKPCLCISLGESEEELRTNAEAIGFDLNNISFLD